mmetsp:Transcript_118535/g.166669  ORF Transcript_118535/g.166669 Transcript_118535/m.166669 type:complete len:106 (-) Transcript_118535:16-333(-)|eukprot:s2217_g7.t1
MGSGLSSASARRWQSLGSPKIGAMLLQGRARSGTHMKKSLRKWNNKFRKVREHYITKEQGYFRPLHWPSDHLDRGEKTPGWDRSGASGADRGTLRVWAKLDKKPR